MILKFIYSPSSPVKNIPPCTADYFFILSRQHHTISFMLLLCPKHHNCSYDHFNCSLFYNQVIFKGLSVFYPAPICLSKSQTILLFCSYAVNPRNLKKTAFITEITSCFSSHVHLCATKILCLLVHLFPR